MIKYGFELEAFALRDGTELTIPPNRSWPVDGFPGLIEFRSSGGKDIHDAFGDLLSHMSRYPNIYTYKVNEHKFTAQEKATLRRDRSFQKDYVDVQNVYGREPKDVGLKTLASFQINVSNELSPEYKDKDGSVRPARYGLLDVPNIVKRLDEEFGVFIKASNRRPGFYAIKDGYRLEYRSLPNSIFPEEINEINRFLTRIKKAVEG